MLNYAVGWYFGYPQWAICPSFGLNLHLMRSGSVVECLLETEGPRVRDSPASLRCDP